MADLPPPDTPAVPSVPSASRVQRFLRKARGQIEKPVNQNLQFEQRINSKGGESDSGSDHGASLGDTKQLAGAAYAEGGLTKFYAPIPEYEGRHRWDPTAEWTDAEEKRLVRRVSLNIYLIIYNKDESLNPSRC
jgi:hypothetical protein